MIKPSQKLGPPKCCSQSSLNGPRLSASYWENGFVMLLPDDDNLFSFRSLIFVQISLFPEFVSYFVIPLNFLTTISIVTPRNKPTNESNRPTGLTLDT